VDPSGNPVNVVSITPVAGSNDTQFDVTFDPQAGLGTYTLTVGPNVRDFYGNPMAAPFTGQFTIISELIVNGSFEMGFTGWTPGPGWIITTPGHSGTNCAGSGAVGGTTPLSQVIATVVGQQYTFSFWYARVDGTPAEIHAFFGGVDVYDEVNTASHGYEFHSFTVTATSTSTTILFMGRNDPSYDDLDDVSVSATAAPAPRGGGGAHPRPVSAAHVLVGSGLLLPAGLGTGIEFRPSPVSPVAPPSGAGRLAKPWRLAPARFLDQVFADLRADNSPDTLLRRGADAGNLVVPVGLDLADEIT
jgi:hypothetical protein